jgi:hypothetical protein
MLFFLRIARPDLTCLVNVYENEYAALAFKYIAMTGTNRPVVDESLVCDRARARPNGRRV